MNKPLSLRRALVLWLFIPLAALLLIWAMAVYLGAHKFATDAYDKALLENAVDLSDLARKYYAPGQPLNLPQEVVRAIMMDARDATYYAIFDRQGKTMAGAAWLGASANLDAAPARPRFYYVTHGGVAVRVAVLPVRRVAAGAPAWVLAAETLNKRDRLAQELLIEILAPQVVLLLLAAGLVWFGVKRGLAPLERVRQAVEKRSATHLEPLPLGYTPEEVRPLVGAINNLMERLQGVLATQQGFIADAAHQLRTPLAGLKGQIDLALSQPHPEDIKHAVSQARISTERMIRLSHQLLVLARNEPRAAAGAAQQSLDLSRLARETAMEWVPAALKKNIDLGFDGSSEAWVRGNEVSLRELIANLLDNALRYTPAGGAVTLAVSVAEDVRLSVTDSGPGIPAAHRARVLERFYRLPGEENDGCGLGLAIVHEIAQAHGAEVGIDAAPGGGCRVSVRFPRPPYSAPAYFATILSGAVEALSEQDMHALVCPTGHQHNYERSLIEELVRAETDGAVLVLPEESPAELRELKRQGFRFVVVDPLYELDEDIPVVSAANAAGAHQATEHLLSLGHRRIGAITGPTVGLATRRRLMGYHSAQVSAGVIPDPALEQEGDYLLAGGIAAARRLLALPDPPTAILAFNDSMAVGAIRVARELGLRVPDELSVVGFDDTVEAEIAHPPLTTVRQPLAEMAGAAVRLVLAAGRDDGPESQSSELVTSLVVRETSAPPAVRPA